MKRHFLFLITVVAFGFPAFSKAQISATTAHNSEPECSMAVLNLKAGNGYTDKGAMVLTDVVSEHIAKYAGCSVLSREEIRSVLSFEAEKQLLGCADDSCMTELGGALGVDFLVVGSISKVGDSTLVSIKKIDLSSLKVLRRITDTSAGSDEEIVAFVAWMATRLAAGDEAAGAKPKVVKKIKKVQVVEKQTTLWRTMAWTGLATTGFMAAVTGLAIGTTYGLSSYVQWTKQQPEVDTESIAYADNYGPSIAMLANVSMYTTLAMIVPTVILFLMPAEEIAQNDVDSELVPVQQNKSTANTDAAASSPK